jgi:hypothetical protein
VPELDFFFRSSFTSQSFSEQKNLCHGCRKEDELELEEGVDIWEKMFEKKKT